MNTETGKAESKSQHSSCVYRCPLPTPDADRSGPTAQFRDPMARQVGRLSAKGVSPMSKDRPQAVASRGAVVGRRRRSCAVPVVGDRVAVEDSCRSPDQAWLSFKFPLTDLSYASGVTADDDAFGECAQPVHPHAGQVEKDQESGEGGATDNASGALRPELRSGWRIRDSGAGL
jgi:hypothetical protein